MSKYDAPYYTTIAYDEEIELGVYVKNPECYSVQTITAMAYDSDGNALKKVCIDIEYEFESDYKKVESYLWSNYGIDVTFDFKVIDGLVWQSWERI